MRVLHVPCIAPPEHGGIGRVAALEVKMLAERGIDVSLASLTTHTGFRFGNAGRIYALDHLVRETDIVHLHYPFFGTAEQLPALRHAGAFRRLVVTLHMDAAAAGIKGRIFEMYRRAMQSRILDAADLLIGSSRDYIQHSSFAPYADRVVELPFGVDETMFAPGPAHAERYGVPEGAPIILFVGGMDRAHAFKGVSYLLEALVNVPASHLVLVGEGALRAGYEAQAKRLGVAERCHFVGAMNDAGLAEAYRSASVLAFPSVSRAEAFGLVAVEAQASGVPVIASDLPGVRTVIESGVTGFLVPPMNASALATALRDILSDEHRRQTMGKAARERVLARYTWKQHIDQLLALYQRLV